MNILPGKFGIPLRFFRPHSKLNVPVGDPKYTSRLLKILVNHEIKTKKS